MPAADGALEQVLVDCLVVDQVELEPHMALARRGDLLDRLYRHGGGDEGQVVAGRGAREMELALRPQAAAIADRGNADGGRIGLAEEGRCGIAGLHIDAIARGEGDGLEGAAVAGKTLFGIAGAGEIAFEETRDAATGQHFGIGKGGAAAQVAGKGQIVEHGCDLDWSGPAP